MAHARPFRFGVLAEHVSTYQNLVDTARAAEAAGYATFLIRDHWLKDPFGHQLGPWTTLATAAAVTRTLRVGSLVFANDYRPPVMLAKEAATLDLLSGGRFELGLGTGFLRAEYEQAGIAFDPPGVRVARLEESLRVLKGLFAGAPLTHAGAHHTLTEMDSFPTPVQRPHPPILVGAGGKRMLQIAAREADIIGILTATISDGVLRTGDPTDRMAAGIAQRIEWVREAAGGRFDQLELSLVSSIVITDDRERAAARYAQERGWTDVSVDDVLAMPSLFIGSIEQIVQSMHARRAPYGVSYHVLSDRDLETAAPIVARLADQ